MTTLAFLGLFSDKKPLRETIKGVGPTTGGPAPRARSCPPFRNQNRAAPEIWPPLPQHNFPLFSTPAGPLGLSPVTSPLPGGCADPPRLSWVLENTRHQTCLSLPLSWAHFGFLGSFLLSASSMPCCCVASKRLPVYVCEQKYSTENSTRVKLLGFRCQL